MEYKDCNNIVLSEFLFINLPGATYHPIPVHQVRSFSQMNVSFATPDMQTLRTQVFGAQEAEEKFKKND